MYQDREFGACHYRFLFLKKQGEVLVDDEVFENVAKIYEKEGSDCWFNEDYQIFLGDKYKAEDYEKLSDIVEVWFDSGSTHFFCLKKKETTLNGQHLCI